MYFLKTQQARAKQVIWGKTYESIFSLSKDFTSVCFSWIRYLRIQSGGRRDLTLCSIFFFYPVLLRPVFPSSFCFWWQNVTRQEPNEQHEWPWLLILLKSGCLANTISIWHFNFSSWAGFFLCKQQFCPSSPRRSHRKKGGSSLLGGSSRNGFEHLDLPKQVWVVYCLIYCVDNCVEVSEFIRI